jgi:hypothetical protein
VIGEKMTRQKKFTLEIPVRDVTDKMYLRSEVAEGETDDGTKLQICSVVPDGSLYYKIGDKAYLVGMRDILKALLEMLGTE